MIHQLETDLGREAVIDRQPFNAADMRDTAADISKARNLLGWEPRVSPQDGLKALAQWYQEEAHWLAPALDAYDG
jgi:nucleoside-diphosphate-sugar epimerase